MPGPHDLLARYTFAHPERAAAELRAVLPPHVVSAVDWSSLRREPGSVVDPELRETESDLLFSARLHEGGSLLLYVLLEHESSVDVLAYAHCGGRRRALAYLTAPDEVRALPEHLQGRWC